jgi:hypothetical protein
MSEVKIVAAQEHTIGENIVIFTVALLLDLICAGAIGYLPVLATLTLGQRFIAVLATRYLLKR